MCMFPTTATAKPLSSPPPIDDGKQRGLERRASDLLFAPKAGPLPGLARDPKQAADRPKPPRLNFTGGAPLNDAPLSEWDLRPIVDFGVVRGLDSQGSGAFGANRTREDGNEPHGGVDIAVPVGTPVRAPAGGEVALFHPKPGLIGIQITTPDKRILKVIYVAPMDGIVQGSTVRSGQPIGHSQSLQQRYPGITDHVHFQVERRDQEPPALVDPTEIVRRWFFPPKY